MTLVDRPLAAFKDLCIDTNDVDVAEGFWAAVLGLTRKTGASGSSWLQDADGELVVWVNDVPEPRTAKNRVHLDVHATDVGDVLSLGATVVREPGEDSWWSLADREGGELCVFVRGEVSPLHRLYEIVVDARDHGAQAEWWASVLGGDVEHDTDFSGIERVSGLPAQYFVFQNVPEPKTVKNRIHWDVTGDAQELVRHGARILREPTEQDEWHVLADPEGNEFCVFAP